MGSAWHLLTDQDVDLSKLTHSIILRLFSAKVQRSVGEENSIGWTRDHEMIPKMSLGFLSWRKEALGRPFCGLSMLKGDL